MSQTSLPLTPAGGLSADETEMLSERLERALRRLADHAAVATEISRRETVGADPLLTLEVWIPGTPRLVATSDQEDLGAAAADIEQRILAQLATVTGRRRDQVVRRSRQHKLQERSS